MWSFPCRGLLGITFNDVFIIYIYISYIRKLVVASGFNPRPHGGQGKERSNRHGIGEKLRISGQFHIPSSCLDQQLMYRCLGRNAPVSAAVKLSYEGGECSDDVSSELFHVMLYYQNEDKICIILLFLPRPISYLSQFNLSCY